MLSTLLMPPKNRNERRMLLFKTQRENPQCYQIKSAQSSLLMDRTELEDRKGEILKSKDAGAEDIELCFKFTKGRYSDWNFCKQVENM